MSNLTRRAILRGSASAIVAGAVSTMPAIAAEPIGASHPSNTIAELFAEWRELRLSIDGPSDEGYDGDREDWVNEHSAAMAEIEHAIAEIPGQSPADIAVKLWLDARGLEVDYASDITDAEAYAPKDSLDQCLNVSALRDAERLSGSVWKGGAA